MTSRGGAGGGRASGRSGEEAMRRPDADDERGQATRQAARALLHPCDAARAKLLGRPVFAIAGAAGGRRPARGPCALRWQADSHTPPASHSIKSPPPSPPLSPQPSNHGCRTLDRRLKQRLLTLRLVPAPPSWPPVRLLVPFILQSAALSQNAPTTCPACVAAFPTSHLHSVVSFNSPSLFHHPARCCSART